MADSRGDGGGAAATTSPPGSSSSSLSLSQLQNLVSARKSATTLAKSPSNRKVAVKCSRCGTKKRVPKDKLNMRTKCVCGEVFVAQARQRSPRASPTSAPGKGVTLPSLSSRFRIAAKRAVGKFGVGDLAMAQLQLSKLPDARQTGKVWKAEPNYEGNEARNDFFDMYKSTGKMEMLRRDAEEDSPRQAYFEAAQRLGLSPEPGKILRKTGASAASDRINIRDYSLGDTRIIAMLPALKLMGYQSMDLSGNRVGPKGAAALASSLPDTCFELDLSRNGLTSAAVEGLSRQVLFDQKYEVCQLNLAGNGLRDDAMRMLAMGIGNCASLRRLNLSDNGFSDAGAAPVVEALASCSQLVDLSLSWNNVHRTAIAALRDLQYV